MSHRPLVRYLLLPVLRALTALGTMHVATFWHPELGPPPCTRADAADDHRRPYRTSRAGFQREPEAWRRHPTPGPFRGEL